MVVMVPAVGGGAWRRGGDVDGGCGRATGVVLMMLVAVVSDKTENLSGMSFYVKLKWWRLSWCSNGGDEVGDDEGVAVEEIVAMVVMVPAVGGGAWRRGGDVDGGCGRAAGVVLMMLVAVVSDKTEKLFGMSFYFKYFNFNNENELWEFNLDIDDSDIHLTPVVRSSSSTHVELSPYTSNPVTIIPGLAGIIQLSSSTRVEPSPSTTNSVRIIRGHAGIITGTIHYKVLDVGSYGTDITVRAAMILANVSVFTPKPSQHYLNITMRNVIEVFRKDTFLGSGSGRLLSHARGLGFKPRRGGFPSGAKKGVGLSPKLKVRVLHTTQLDVTKVVEDVDEDDDFNSGAWVSTTNYVNVFGGAITGCLRDIDNFLKKKKLEQVVAIVKSCSPNMLDDLNVTLKDLSDTITEIKHYKVLDVGIYENDITVRAAMILTNVSVFTHKPSQHYLNVTMRNVIEVFRKDTVLESGSG
nr:hypothetical protein [Tanacetum cinerariifolium]